MRKRFAILVFLAAALLSTATISPTKADIGNYNWIAPVYYGYDSFYGSTVYAYETGSTAELLVSVYNDYYVGWYDYKPVNVSAVKVWFDWGENYSSTECSEVNPITIEPYQTHYFMVSFTVPSTTVAPNTLRHDWRIYVEHINSTTGPKEIVGTWTEYPYYDFAVYSAEQADSMEVYQKIEAVIYPTPYFTSSEAKTLWTEAKMKESEGEMYLTRGDFTNANTTLYGALDLIDQALTVEKSRGPALEDAQMNSLNAAVTEGYGRLLLGLGALVIGVGVIVYAIKKPKIQ